MLIDFAWIAVHVFSLEAVFIAAIIMLAKRSDAICRAPALDIAVSLLTWIPWAGSIYAAGWLGLGACIIGQIAALEFFVFIHPILLGYKGPTIKASIDKIVGKRNNYLGLYVTLPVLPFFLCIRLSEITLWPLLVRIMKFPKYEATEWINVSRQKFSGLVGHDLVWCLYCDWMTGVYSLGGEMLRNVETIWCPIRYYDGKKCENCKVDFPDIDSWVPADGEIKDVKILLEDKYPADSKKPRSWFGHPDRKDSPKQED